MSAPALYRDSDGGIKRFDSTRETVIECQGLEALTNTSAVSVFDDVTSGNITIGAALTGNLTLGNASGNRIFIDNTGDNRVEIEGNLYVNGTETVTGNTTFNEDVQIGDGSEPGVDLLTVWATSTFHGDTKFEDNTVVTFGTDGLPDTVEVDTTYARFSADIVFDGSAQAVTNDSADLTVSTTTSGDLLLTGADHVTVTTGSTAGDAFAVNTDDLYVDGNTSNVSINTATALPSGNEAQLTVAEGTADTPVISLKAGAAAETALLTGSTDPSAGGGVAAPRGSLYLRNTTTEPLYVKTNTGDADWSKIGTATSSDLQSAYDAGPTIALASGVGDLAFTVDEVTTFADWYVDGSAANDKYIWADADNNKLILGSANIPIDSANDIQMVGTTPTINATALDLSLTTTTSGDVIINAADQVGIGTASPSANTAATVSAAADRVLALENVADSAVVELQTGTDPTGITGTTGSLYMEYDGTTGANAKLWINQSDTGSGTTWTELSTDPAVSQQDAYDNGPGVTMTAADGDMTLTVDETSTFADFQVTGATGNYIVSDAENKKVILGSDNATDVTVDVDATMNFTGTTRLITSDSAALLISTSTSGNILIDAADSAALSTTAGFQGFLISAVGTTTMSAPSGQDVEISATGVGGTISLDSADTAAGAVSITASGAGGGVLIDADTLLNVDATNIDMDATGASAFTVTGANLTLETVTSGDVDINSAAAVDIDTVTFDMLSSGNFSIDGSGASNVTATTGNLTLSTVTSGDLLLTSAADVDVDASSGEFTLSSGTAEIMSILTGTVDPSAVATSANAGSLFLRDDTSTGEVYVKQDDGSSTDWLQLATIADSGDVVMTATTAEAVTVGDLVYLDSSGDAGLADADTAAKVRPVGIALDTDGVGGATIRIALAGEVALNSAITAGDEGKYVYMDTTTAGGVVTDVSGYGTGDTVLRIGVVTASGAAGTAKAAVSFGEPTLL